MRRSAAYFRFQNIPRTYTGCIYVAELRTGVVKVGRSQNPRTRMHSLTKQVRRELRTEIPRFFISPDVGHCESRDLEAEALRRFRRIGQPVAGSTEFFTGVHFNVAAQIVRQLTELDRLKLALRGGR